ncbi:MAG TPA: hypothetical protein VK530_19705, partial [Candidatus Acidoferrum sp.]|nr:hypothetical protein [Candidatus Acidoferrum sp.]
FQRRAFQDLKIERGAGRVIVRRNQQGRLFKTDETEQSRVRVFAGCCHDDADGDGFWSTSDRRGIMGSRGRKRLALA